MLNDLTLLLAEASLYFAVVLVYLFVGLFLLFFALLVFYLALLAVQFTCKTLVALLTGLRWLILFDQKCLK